MGKMIELKASDGHKLAAYRADPAAKPRGAVVVIQEIFGVNSHIKSVADGYAKDGYLAIAPAMFDRVQRGYYDAAASKLARERTLEFFRKHLGWTRSASSPSKARRNRALRSAPSRGGRTSGSFSATTFTAEKLGPDFP